MGLALLCRWLAGKAWQSSETLPQLTVPAGSKTPGEMHCRRGRQVVPYCAAFLWQTRPCRDI